MGELWIFMFCGIMHKVFEHSKIYDVGAYFIHNVLFVH